MRRLALLAVVASLVVGGVVWWRSQQRTETAPTVTQAPPANETVPPAAAPRVEVYFARETEDARFVLVPVERSVAEDASPASVALQELAKGPTADEQAAGLLATLPAGTRVLGTKVEGGVAVANFSSELQGNFNGGTGWEEIVLYSVVDTLTGVRGVEGVRIHVNGEAIESIGEHFSADELLRRNETLVARGQRR